MKIVVIGTRGIPNVMGGVETHCEELYPRLAAKGYDVTVIRRSTYVRTEMPMDEWNGVRLVDIKAPKKKMFEAIIHTWRAINKAKSLHADIVHIHAVGPCILAPYARLRGMKVVMTHHGADYDRDKWGRAAKMMLRLGEKLGCKYANHVIVISDVIKKLVSERRHRTKNISLIYNGVNEAEFCSAPSYFKELRIEEGKYVLGMCRFVREKKLHHLIKAFSMIKDKIDPKMKLVLAGDALFDDEYIQWLRDLAHKNGVVLTGFVKGEKLRSLLSHTACYVLPSNHEGLPISLLEAMSYKAPVIASDIPANMEVELPKECYFPCGDVKALADRLQTVLNNGSSKVEYNMTKYNWDHIADQVADVYESL